MRRWKLIRLADGPDGTVGILEADTGVTWYAIEEEDQHNASNISRIPAGTYVCRRRMYHKGGYETFEITGVPSRSAILFHIANTEEDVSGCVGLGNGVGLLTVDDEDTGLRRRKLAVTMSRAAFHRFMDALKGVEEFELAVIDPGMAA